MHRVLFAILLAGAAAMQGSAWPTSPPKQTREAKAKVAEQDRAKATETKLTARQQSKAQAARPNPKPNVQAQKAPQTHPAVKPRVQNRPVSRPATRAPSVEHRRPPVVSKTARFGTQPPLRAERRPTPQAHWSTDWRNNHRYDWHDYRQHHRSVYHLHSYRDPFGWAYQVFAIGWRLWPNYYSSSYWINDPWMYRLPPAPPGTRWIRYYNDALLVDMWSGEVIDVIHNFFW
jgi:hypothetical protein